MGSKIEVGKDWFLKTDTFGPAGEKFQTEWGKLPDTEMELQSGKNAVFSKGSWVEVVSIDSKPAQTIVSVSPALFSGIEVLGDVAVQDGAGAEELVYTLSGDSAVLVKPISLHSYLQVVNKPDKGR